MQNKSPIKPLGLEDALRLYGEIFPFIEVDDEKDFSLSSIQKIITNMRDRDPFAYINCVEIMSGKTQDEIIHSKVVDIFDLFLNGLVANHIPDLFLFCSGLRFRYDKRE